MAVSELLRFEDVALIYEAPLVSLLEELFVVTVWLEVLVVKLTGGCSLTCEVVVLFVESIGGT